MSGQEVEHVLAVLDAAAGGEALAEHHLGGGVVHVGAEEEVPLLRKAQAAEALGAREPPLGLLAAGGRDDGPAGEGARHLDDVVLRVAAVDAQGVQLHQLAGVVLVQAALALGRRLGGAPRPHPLHFVVHRRRHVRRGGRLRVVEVEEHRGVAGGRLEQPAHPPQGVRADGVALIGEEPGAGLVVGRRDVEVVEPEVGHHLGELVLRLDGAVELLRRQLVEQLAHRAIPLLGRPAQHRLAHLLAVGVVGRFLPDVSDIVGDDAGLLGLAQHLPHVRVGARDLPRRQLEGGEGVELGGEPRVGEVRRQLALEPAVEPHLDDAVDLAGAGSVGKSIEQVGRRFTLAKTRRFPRQVNGGLTLGGLDDRRRVAPPGEAEGDGDQDGESQGCGSHGVSWVRAFHSQPETPGGAKTCGGAATSPHEWEPFPSRGERLPTPHRPRRSGPAGP